MLKIPVLSRNGEVFSREIEDIKNKRLEFQIDKKRKSTRTLTNLLVKHTLWMKIKNDMINLNLEKRKNE